MLLIGLVAVIGYEFYSLSAGPHSDHVDLSLVPVLPRTVIPHDDKADTLKDVLARPLFQIDRRPPVVASARIEPSVGRLTGILISQNDKRLIFSGVPDGKPVILTEGDHIGSDIVQSIDVGQATLVGPGGVTVVQPSFDKPDQAKPHAPPIANPKSATEPESRMSKRHF